MKIHGMKDEEFECDGELVHHRTDVLSYVGIYCRTLGEAHCECQGLHGHLYSSARTGLLHPGTSIAI